MKLVFAAQFEAQEEGGFVVTFRDLPEAITEGDSVEDALANASDCLDEAIAARLDDGEEIPVPTPLEAGEYLVAVPVESAIKVALVFAVRDRGITKSTLAEMLGVTEKAARRLLDPHHSSRLRVMQRALSVLGAQVQVEVERGVAA